MWKYIKFGIFLLASNLPLLVTAVQTLSVASTLKCNDGTQIPSHYTLYRTDDIATLRIHSNYNRDLELPSTCTYVYDEVNFGNENLADFDTYTNVALSNGDSALMRIYRRYNGFTGYAMYPQGSGDTRWIKAGTLVSWLVN